MNFNNLLQTIPGLEPEELSYLQGLTEGLDENKMRAFIRVYNEKRQSANTILLTCLIGLLGIAGIHRFLIGEILMGIVYLLTAGLCYIGTIVDAVNYKELTRRHNIKAANDAFSLINAMGNF